MAMTHIPKFGKVKYMHVTIDTFSGFLMATAQAGEATKHIITHYLKCFSAIDIPQMLKTNNGSSYTSQAFQKFCTNFLITHKTKIPNNPQGKVIVKKAHGSLKTQLNKIKKGELYVVSPQNSLHHALFVLNFLIFDAHGRSAAERFWHPTTQSTYAQVRWKDPLMGT